jgi:nanoRNase/pAp phosphatase (c-di-AMP/oligoRNAs hydrolase)
MEYPDCRMREINYNDDPDFIKEILINEKVFIVDFSFKPEKMKELFKITAPNNVIWIDHHKTAKDYVYLECPGTKKDMTKELPGLRDFSEPGKSGCELAWEYFSQFDRYYCGGKPAPEAVRLLGDYDTWRFHTENKTKLFQMGMKLYSKFIREYNLGFWYSLFDKDSLLFNEVLSCGSTIIKYRDEFCEDYRNSYGWETEFEGHKCYVMNVHTLGSLGFGPEIDNYNICIACVFSGKKWTVSLYSKKIDVSEIAKKHGGGGHSGAAGFVCDELPF